MVQIQSKEAANLACYYQARRWAWDNIPSGIWEVQACWDEENQRAYYRILRPNRAIDRFVTVEEIEAKKDQPRLYNGR